MRKLFLLLMIFYAAEADAQTAVIHGKIKATDNNEIMSGVTVSADLSHVTASDSTGNYSLELNEGEHTIVFSFISFQSKIITIKLSAGENRSLDVVLGESEHQLNTVVVSAGKFEQRIEDVTVSMEVLKPEFIQNRNTTTMEDAMDYVPGVSIIDGQANIRGGSGWSYGAGSRVQILVDDLPQLTADANDVKWTFLPVENLDQVEVIKGASSVLFGSSALNGVINFRTAYPKDQPVTKITFFQGIYDTPVLKLGGEEYNLRWWGDRMLTTSGSTFFHSEKINRFDLVVATNIFEDQGYRQGENERRGRFNFNTRYRFKKIEGLSAGVNFNTMTTYGTLFFLFANDTTGGYVPAANTLSDYRTYRTNVDPFITYTGKKGSTLRLRTRWFQTLNENNTDQNSKAILYYYELQYQKHFNDKINLTAGAVNVVSVVTSELYGEHDGNQRAAYLQGDFKFGRLTVSAGARAEKNKVDSAGDDVTPVFRSGINYNPFGGTFLRASFGQGYRFPSIAEKFIKTNVGSVVIYPNNDLEPEKGSSYEIGVKQVIKIQSWTGYFDAAAFQNDYKNMMEFSFGQWGSLSELFYGNGFKSLNVGNTKIKGIELTLGGTGKIAGDINATLLLGYTFIDPRQVSYDSLYVQKIGVANIYGSDSTSFLKYRSKNTFKGDILFSRKKISAGMSVRYASRIENIDRIFTNGLLDAAFSPGLGIGHYRNNEKKNGNIIYDLRAAYRISPHVELSLIVKNLFNYIYMQRPGDMQPPRMYVGQVSFTL